MNLVFDSCFRFIKLGLLVQDSATAVCGYRYGHEDNGIITYQTVHAEVSILSLNNKFVINNLQLTIYYWGKKE